MPFLNLKNNNIPSESQKEVVLRLFEVLCGWNFETLKVPASPPRSRLLFPNMQASFLVQEHFHLYTMNVDLVNSLGFWRVRWFTCDTWYMCVLFLLVADQLTCWSVYYILHYTELIHKLVITKLQNAITNLKSLWRQARIISFWSWPKEDLKEAISAALWRHGLCVFYWKACVYSPKYIKNYEVYESKNLALWHIWHILWKCIRP